MFISPLAVIYLHFYYKPSLQPWNNIPSSCPRTLWEPQSHFISLKKSVLDDQQQSWETKTNILILKPLGRHHSHHKFPRNAFLTRWTIFIDMNVDLHFVTVTLFSDWTVKRCATLWLVEILSCALSVIKTVRTGDWTSRASLRKWVRLSNPREQSFTHRISPLMFILCVCVSPQRLCIFDNYGTLVFAVFMSVWGEW